MKWSGERPPLYTLIPFCSIFILFGLAPSQLKHGFVLDKNRGVLHSYWKLFITLNSKIFRITEIKDIQLEESHAGDGPSTYKVALLTDGGSSIIATSTSKILISSLIHKLKSSISNQEARGFLPKQIERFHIPAPKVLWTPLFWFATIPIISFFVIASIIISSMKLEYSSFFYLIFILPIIAMLGLFILKFGHETIIDVRHHEVVIAKKWFMYESVDKIDIDHLMATTEQSLENHHRIFQFNLYPLEIIYNGFPYFVCYLPTLEKRNRVIAAMTGQDLISNSSV